MDFILCLGFKSPPFGSPLDPLWIPFGFPLDSIWIPFGSLIGVQMKVGKQFFFLEQNKLVCWIPFGSPLDL